MLKAQKKISKKEIKEDKLVKAYFEARVWIEQNRKYMSYIIGIPLLLVVITIVWTQKRKDWNETATTMLSRVMPLYEQGRYEEAIHGVPQQGIQGLEVIVQEYGSTSAGEIATLYLAHSYKNLENYEKALEYYKEVDISDPILEASALAGAGICYEHVGKYEEAAECFEEAASKGIPVVQAAENLQRAALNYALVGNTEKAKKLLTIIKKEYSKSPQARDIDKLLAQITA
ncbi:MAG: tetratricopeptide repeat protein [Bacteroidetes bacterium]|nr:tetratricopeptide repeat protein [Bacteroidota bacterium]